MANILLRLNTDEIGPPIMENAQDVISVGPHIKGCIFGEKGTYCIVRNGEDIIASVGYTSFIDFESQQESLVSILNSFLESKIGELKQKLVGQYVLMIKKGTNIYLFSDFMGARNIFYSEDGMVFSSSFSNVEKLVQTTSDDLDMYTFLELLAMRGMFYPTWIGRDTDHKRIKWLLPYEYISINTENCNVKVNSLIYSFDNEKQSDRIRLADELIKCLTAIIFRKEFKESKVAASLTGGRDSRLIATIAANSYKNIHFRTATSTEKVSSLKDLKVAVKVAKRQGVPLDVYRYQAVKDEEKFRELTEGISPSFNQSIMPIIDNVGRYSLGFGGVFGSELFEPIPWKSFDEFVQVRGEKAKQVFHVGSDFWERFYASLYDAYHRIKEHYQLNIKDDRDYIRLFILLDTARYGSFILSAFNKAGYQFEPYGSSAVLDLALRVDPRLWGYHKGLGGDALIQMSAMAKLNPKVARVLTYKAFRPMLPLSIMTSPLYLMGFSLQVLHWLRERFDDIKKGSERINFPGGYYIARGWEKNYFKHLEEIYGLLYFTNGRR